MIAKLAEQSTFTIAKYDFTETPQCQYVRMFLLPSKRLHLTTGLSNGACTNVHLNININCVFEAREQKQGSRVDHRSQPGVRGCVSCLRLLLLLWGPRESHSMAGSCISS